LLGLVFVKILAAGITLGSGGSGGVFAPALFVGACLGGAFGMFVEYLFPGQTAHSGAYALVGMGAVLAGATHAPITAIIMLFELTGNYHIILPLMLSCIISVVLATKGMPTSIFTTRLLQKGIRLRSSSESELMRTTKIRRIFRPHVESMGPETSLTEVMKRAFASSLPHQYVVDNMTRLHGVITNRRLKIVLAETEDLGEDLIVAADIMKSPVTRVTLDDTLAVAMSHISRLDVEMLPVVDEEQRLVGCVTRHDMMVFFEHEIMKDNQLGMKFVSTDRPDESRFVEIPEGHRVEIVDVSKLLAGKSLRDLDLRATAGLNVIGIRRQTTDGVQRIQPDPASPLLLGDKLVVVGEQKAIAAFKGALFI